MARKKHVDPQDNGDADNAAQEHGPLAGTQQAEQQSGAKPPRPAPTRGTKGYQLDLTVKMGMVSISDSDAAISCTASKSGKDGVVGLNIKNAERFLCGKRLDVALTPEDEQESIPGMEPQPVYGVADVASFSVKPKKLNFRLKFSNEDFDYSQLSKLANLESVKLQANLTGQTADDEQDDEADASLFEQDEDTEQAQAA